MIEDLCPPALLYLIFLVVQLGLDAAFGLWVTFVIKILFGSLVVLGLNTFCGIGLSVVSWFLVAAPFVITALGTAVAMGMRLDESILDRFKESFVDEMARDKDLPASASAVERMLPEKRI